MHPELVPFGTSTPAVLAHRGVAEDWALFLNIAALLMYSEEGRGLESFTQPERFIYAIGGLLREVNNGGYEQFFSNGSGALAYDVVPALRAVGSVEFLPITLEAMALFGTAPDLSQENRWKHLSEITRDAELALWETCDVQFYACEEQLETLALNYIERNLSEMCT